MRTSGKWAWPSITGRSRLAAHSATSRGVASPSCSGAPALAIQVVEEPLIVALQLVIEHDTLHGRAPALQAFGRVHYARYSWASCASSRGFTKPA